MERRKIQLIAGTTYSVSLPKGWVKKNNLKEKSEVEINDENDGTLSIYPGFSEKKDLDKMNLLIEDYQDNIDQILFSLYYLGIEEINFMSKKEISAETKAKIRNVMDYMSGSEIVYEDKTNIKIKVFLDKSKVNINQVFYRIFLLIESSLNHMQDKRQKTELRNNEKEIDRLYHLIVKIISLSLANPKIIKSSGVNNISLIPSYFLISKRLEHIGDRIYQVSKYIRKNNKSIPINEISKVIESMLERAIKHIINYNSNIFKKENEEKKEGVQIKIMKIKDLILKKNIEEIFRYCIDIQEEAVNISFYNMLIKEKKI